MNNQFEVTSKNQKCAKFLTLPSRGTLSHGIIRFGCYIRYFDNRKSEMERNEYNAGGSERNGDSK